MEKCAFCNQTIKEKKQPASIEEKRRKARENYYVRTANSGVYRRGPYKKTVGEQHQLPSEEKQSFSSEEELVREIDGPAFYNSMIPSDDWDRTKPIHISNGFYVFPDGHISKS